MLTSQKFKGIRELVTSLHREIRAQLDQVHRVIYLFILVGEEYMHIYLRRDLNSQRTRGEPGIEPMVSINLVLN